MAGRRIYAAVRLSLVVSLTGTTSWAASPAEQGVGTPDARALARSLATEGREAYNAGDYARAIDRFRQAYALVPAPTIAIYEARALERSGRLVEARDAYVRTTHASVDPRSPEQFHRAIVEANAELASLSPKIPKLVVVWTGSAAPESNPTLTLDGEPLTLSALGTEIPLNPGNHRVALRTRSGEEKVREVSLGEGETRRVDFRMDVAAPTMAATLQRSSGSGHDLGRTDGSRPGTRRTAAYIAFGVGAAGLGTGIVTGLMAASERAAADSQCPDHVCTQGSAGEDALDSFRVLRTVSTTAYVVGAVGVVTGVVILVFPSGDANRTTRSVQPWIGASSVGVRGVF